jgi:hypothetical protein
MEALHEAGGARLIRQPAAIGNAVRPATIEHRAFAGTIASK